MTDMNPKFRSIMLNPDITRISGVDMYRSSANNGNFNQLMFRNGDDWIMDVDQFRTRCVLAGADADRLNEHIYEMSRFLVFHIDHPKG